MLRRRAPFSLRYVRPLRVVTFNLVLTLAEFVCLLDLLVSVEEYKLDGKKPWITFQDEFISQAEAAGMTETIKDITYVLYF